MFGDNTGVIIVLCLVLIAAYFVCYKSSETFSALLFDLDQTQYNDYGLRGEPHVNACIHDRYISDKRHIRMSDSGEVMWESTYPPSQFGLDSCEKRDCPKVNGFDNLDTCWTCSSGMN